jgi:hypothetical protein
MGLVRNWFALFLSRIGANRVRLTAIITDYNPQTSASPNSTMPPTSTALVNHYMDFAVATFLTCVRCLSAFKDGEFRYLAECGCCMPDKEEESAEDLYVIMIDEKHVKCFRCMMLKGDCLMVSLGPYEPV